MTLKERIVHIYDKQYKKLLLIPFILILASILIIGVNYAATGEFFQKDVSLKGGITITVFTKQGIDAEQLQTQIHQLYQKEVSVRSISEAGSFSGYLVEADGTDKDVPALLNAIESKVGKLNREQYTVQVIGSSLSNSFLKEAAIAILIAFVLMGLTVMIYFRAFIPSLFVISAAFSDILCTFAVIVLMQEKLSSAGIAAFLMLIGYSVDTDILLTTRVMKSKEGTVFHRIQGAVKTGLFMTLTALAATTVALIFTQSETIRQIMLVLTIGLVFDVLYTWITNAGVLRWYLEAKGQK